ncbi:GNAT family N-acetyltransferase [Flavobacterium frigidarium]|jgi:RimJ/RimL family protein N-acetyltransferase|uniref:GNAT family protein n=1 Tax=Flavobacterium frigidarium TaxID=99286 RepID=A0ABV4KG85_9FLAO
MEFDFSHNIQLENDAVLLRPLQYADIDHLLYFAINQPDTWRYSLVRANGKENMVNYIASAIKSREDKMQFPFIVFDKRTNSYSGCTRFYDINFIHKTLQLGYTWYGEEFRGTVLNKQCKFLLLQFAFEELNIERVEFRADSNNARSIAAMKSIGCVVEGVMRSHMPTYDNPTRRDTIVLSILRNEWFETVKQNLQAAIAII